MSSQVFSITALAFAALSLNSCGLQGQESSCGCDPYGPDGPGITKDSEEEPEEEQ